MDAAKEAQGLLECVSNKLESYYCRCKIIDESKLKTDSEQFK